MGRKNRSPEENARRAKIRGMLQLGNISSMDDIQNLFKETIVEFMENGLEAEIELQQVRLPEQGHSSKRYAPASEMLTSLCPGIERASLSRRF